MVFSLSILLWWIEFSLWDFVLSDWILLWIWEHLIYVLHMNTHCYNGVLYWFTWYMFWHSTRGFPKWHWDNLCIGVDARFHPCFSSRNLGALFEVFFVGLSIMNLKLFDTYRIINSQVLGLTLGYLGDIRVGWYESYGVILVRTLD